jgi:hypothetical protein
LQNVLDGEEQMTIDINFLNIREYDGSKQNGFEELVCQIAHIEKPIDVKKFIRKEGSGGDAGFECFWILDDGREYAWQTKYFTEIPERFCIGLMLR